MIVRDRWFPSLVVPENFCRSERNNEIIPQCARLLEKLEMPGVEDVVAAGNKDFFHGVSVMVAGLGKKDVVILDPIDQSMLLSDPP